MSPTPAGQTPSGLAEGSVSVILPAAGSGRRFGNESNKLFAMLAGRPLWVHAAERLLARPEVGLLLLAVAEQDQDRFSEQTSQLTRCESVRIVRGGPERSDTVQSALQEIETVSASDSSQSTALWVAIHDAARPLVRGDDLTAVFRQVEISGAAILAHRVTGTLKRKRDESTPTQTVNRDDMWVAQTPQVFRRDLIHQAYLRHRGRAATDDAQMVERLGHDVALVAGSVDNLKITYPEDLLIAEAFLQRQNASP